MVRELKDIRLKFNEVYSKFDDWIVVYTKDENEKVNEVISSIRQTIDGNKLLDIDMRISTSDIQADEDGVEFIEAVLDKSFIQTGGQTKFSLDQAQEYISIFKKFARNELIRSSKADNILVTNLKLCPEMIPMKWKEYQLIYLLLNLNFDEVSEFELCKLKAKIPRLGVEKQPPLFAKSG